MNHTKTKAPFRYDIVGSFLRPAALMKTREAYAAGNAGAEELRAAEDAAIRDLVAKEKEVGLRAVTDGEFRRRYWHLDFLAALGGVEELGAAHWSVSFKGAQLKAATVKVEILFGGCHVDGFFLEYDSDRAGGFAPSTISRISTSFSDWSPQNRARSKRRRILSHASTRRQSTSRSISSASARSAASPRPRRETS